MKRTRLALAIVLVALALLMSLDIQAVAAPATPDTECILWADIKPWAITRCESWESGETCFIATSGMMDCWKE